MTFLSVKMLRHYHEIGLLVPSEVDPHSSYRFYDLDQVADAQLVRRFRELDMLLEDIRRAVCGPDAASRTRWWPRHAKQATPPETSPTLNRRQRSVQEA
jgi:DNA-binding transcriptional MerR regulator